MDITEFNKVVNSTVDSILNLLVTKGEEYAGSEDRLANFKRGAQLTGSTTLQVALIYMSKHYDAVGTYVKSCAAGKIPKLSEPIEGRFDDLINYCILMKAIIKENQRDTIKEIKKLDPTNTAAITADAQ